MTLYIFYNDGVFSGLRTLALMFLFCAYQVRSGNVSERVYGGHHISISDAPYIVHLGIRSTSCTGSIIAMKWVLTAAHCLYNVKIPNDIIVHAGIDHLDDFRHAQVRKGKEIVIHPKYDPQERYHDIGLLQVGTKFRLSKKISILPVAGDAWPQDHRQYRRLCKIIGWGPYDDDEMDEHEELNAASIYTEYGIDACACLDIDEKRHSICTLLEEGEENRRTVCGVDSGGPLICDGQVYGIVSHSLRIEDCGMENYSSNHNMMPCATKDTIDIFMYLCTDLQWIQSYTTTTPNQPWGCGYYTMPFSRGARENASSLHMELLAVLISGLFYFT